MDPPLSNQKWILVFEDTKLGILTNCGQIRGSKLPKSGWMPQIYTPKGLTKKNKQPKVKEKMRGKKG